MCFRLFNSKMATKNMDFYLFNSVTEVLDYLCITINQ